MPDVQVIVFFAVGLCDAATTTVWTGSVEKPSTVAGARTFAVVLTGIRGCTFRHLQVCFLDEQLVKASKVKLQEPLIRLFCVILILDSS